MMPVEIGDADALSYFVRSGRHKLLVLSGLTNGKRPTYKETPNNPSAAGSSLHNSDNISRHAYEHRLTNRRIFTVKNYDAKLLHGAGSDVLHKTQSI
ncbi:hypothetical protein JMJ35_004027 [Cladonia borealis]|uniref:Uncharacterized protein n=1 Tax=Cladonia borealis TaxID=184061 RepID=A0AA39R2G3_9LECA|nr:hypothetical protein JMJ35_004027 [Cladonia borealis]